MINVALDGPSGAGKSTIARKAAAQFNFIYIDTGAMFRSLALKALEAGIDIKAEPDGIKAMLDTTVLDIDRADGEQHMILDGRDVTSLIRTPEVSVGASDIAANPTVRSWLLAVERELAGKYDCIMDGRDIGTAVLPDAEVKIFLTASPEERARRRHAELREKGHDVSFEEVLSDMKYRDKQDSERETAPLRQAEDAVLADTTGLSFDESVELVCNIIRKVMH